MKRILIIVLILALLTVLSIIVINLQVGSYSTNRIFNDIDIIPNGDRVAIVLGARARNGEPSDMLYDRVVTAVDLYKAGKTRKLLMSGGDDEPEVMKKLAINLGIPDADIVLDDQGLRTYDSCIRAKHIFEITNAIIVTQDFHLGRSIYLCRNLGVDTIGMNAKRRNYIAEGFGWNREYISSVLAWFDINFSPIPPEQGGKRPISDEPSPTPVAIDPKVSAMSAEDLCDRLGEIENIDSRSPKDSDDLYKAILAKGPDALPCLLDRVSDRTKARDPRTAPKWQHYAVGDTAVFTILHIISKGDDKRWEELMLESLPPKYREEWETNGVYAYFNYVAEPKQGSEYRPGGKDG